MADGARVRLQARTVAAHAIAAAAVIVGLFCFVSYLLASLVVVLPLSEVLQILHHHLQEALPAQDRPILV
jgi:hypothetical protein